MKFKHKLLLGLGLVGAYCGVAYGYDVLYKPHKIAKQARKTADINNKPLLNIGAGTPKTSLRTYLFGPTLWGDVNMDIAGKGPCTPENVCYGDIGKIPYPDKYFGAVIASHVVEHIPNPQKAMAEMHRVADKVYAITPVWWAPHTWIYWDHKWYRKENGTFMPLW